MAKISAHELSYNILVQYRYTEIIRSFIYAPIHYNLTSSCLTILFS